MSYFEKLGKALKEHRLEQTEIAFEEDLQAQPSNVFDALIGLRFTNPATEILRDTNKVIEVCDGLFDLKAVYIEMNGFDVNPDRWFFDFFGYDRDVSDSEDLDWLSDWQSPSFPDVTLRGLEPAQQSFEIYGRSCSERTPEDRAAWEIAVNLVVLKFALLIREILRSGGIARPVPVLATAHDFDSVICFKPGVSDLG